MNAVDVIVAFGFAAWKQLKKTLGAFGLKNRPKPRQPTYEEVCVRVAELVAKVEKRGHAFHRRDGFHVARDLRKLNAPLESIARILKDGLGFDTEWVFRVLHSHTGCDATSGEAIIAIGKGIGPVAEMVAKAVCYYGGSGKPSEIDIAKAMAYQGRSASEIDIALRSPDGLGLSEEQAALVANGFLFPYKTNT